MINDIAAASSEQRAGIEQVSGAIGQMDTMTQQNAAMVEEAAAIASSLQDQATGLAQAISAFQVENHGSVAAPARTQGRLAYAASVRPAARIARGGPRSKPALAGEPEGAPR
jgi:methyl-accepting chemotaxis protein